jgi:predicted secreted protein
LVDLFEDKRSHIKESLGAQLYQLCTLNAGEQKQNSAPAVEEMEDHNKSKISVYYKKKLEVHFIR